MFWLDRDVVAFDVDDRALKVDQFTFCHFDDISGRESVGRCGRGLARQPGNVQLHPLGSFLELFELAQRRFHASS